MTAKSPASAGPAVSLKKPLIWNVAAFGVQGLSGLILMLLIGKYYSPSDLGGFNQAYALLVVFSQFGVWGLHWAVLKLGAEFAHEPIIVREKLSAALGLTALCAALTSALAWAATPLFHYIFRDPAFTTAWEASLPALFLYSINKTLLAYINALSHMRALAVSTAARYLLLLAAFGLWLDLSLPGDRVASIIWISEGTLFIGLSIYVFAGIRPKNLWGDRAWRGRLMNFGGRALVGGLALSLNSRVDILILGLFCPAAQVGLYSMAAMISEGPFQIFAVLRNIINPSLTKSLTRREHGEFARLTGRVKKLTWLGALLIGGPAILLYPLLLPLAVGNDNFNSSAPVFAIIVGGLILSAGYQPFGQLLSQAGYPAAQSLLTVLTLAVNAGLCFALIPLMGIIGAALALAVSYVAGALTLRLLFRRQSGLKV